MTFLGLLYSSTFLPCMHGVKGKQMALEVIYIVHTGLFDIFNHTLYLQYYVHLKMGFSNWGQESTGGC